MSLLDRWGVGVCHVIGLGGRDLSAEVDGRMAKAAIRALRDDPATEVDLLGVQAAGTRGRRARSSRQPATPRSSPR